MKKTLFETMLTLIEGNETAEANEVREAITAELEKGKAKSEANRALYAEMHDKVVQVLTDSTVALTAQEIADETGFAKGKIVHGLNNYWESEVEKDTSGKTTSYRLKVAWFPYPSPLPYGKGTVLSMNLDV